MPTNPQSLEQLKERHRSLENQQIEAKANQKNAEKRLAELKQEAIEKFGTGDLAELQRKLEDMKASNQQKLTKYESDLEKIELQLETIDEKFATEMDED